MAAIINIGDSESIVRMKILDILDEHGVSTEGITSWSIATNRLNQAATAVSLQTLSNNMSGTEARARINALATFAFP